MGNSTSELTRPGTLNVVTRREETILDKCCIYKGEVEGEEVLEPYRKAEMEEEVEESSKASKVSVTLKVVGAETMGKGSNRHLEDIIEEEDSVNVKSEGNQNYIVAVTEQSCSQKGIVDLNYEPNYSDLDYYCDIINEGKEDVDEDNSHKEGSRIEGRNVECVNNRQNVSICLKEKQIQMDTIPTLLESDEEIGMPRYNMQTTRSISVTSQVRSCELIYEIVKSNDGSVSKMKFTDELAILGILPDDPRLENLFKRFDDYGGYEIDKAAFMEAISESISVIEPTFTNSHVIPYFKNFCDQIRALFGECTKNEKGKMSQLIPQLSRQDPNHFGVSICTVSGQRMSIGHTNVDFCVQSCTRPVSYCMALEEHSMDVHNYVGKEPSGERFNALTLMDNGLPHNPLINAGAITICSLIQKDMEPADKFDHVSNTWADLTGGFPLAFSNPAYLSTRTCSDRDFALAHFLKEKNSFPPDVDIEQVLEFYFQIGALSTNADHLSIVASSLANGGVCPLTKKQIFSPETVKNCLSMMYSCGMYDYSGEFAFTIGMPACSNEAGAIMVVIPNVMGMCTFSPRLDEFGNSARGVEFFSKFINKFNFHAFDSIDEKEDDKEDPRKGNDAEEVTVEKVCKYSALGDLGALRRLRPKLEMLITGDYDYRTPLHLAASNGHIDVVEYLLENIGYENVNPIDRWSGSPYDDAIREKHSELAKILKSFGAESGANVAKEG